MLKFRVSVVTAALLLCQFSISQAQGSQPKPDMKELDQDYINATDKALTLSVTTEGTKRCVLDININGLRVASQYTNPGIRSGCHVSVIVPAGATYCASRDKGPCKPATTKEKTATLTTKTTKDDLKIIHWHEFPHERPTFSQAVWIAQTLGSSPDKRALHTEYTNKTGHPMQISVRTHGVLKCGLDVFVAGQKPKSQYYGKDGGNNCNVTAIVPANAKYCGTIGKQGCKTNVPTDGIELEAWYELTRASPLK